MALGGKLWTSRDDRMDGTIAICSSLESQKGRKREKIRGAVSVKRKHSQLAPFLKLSALMTPSKLDLSACSHEPPIRLFRSRPR